MNLEAAAEALGDSLGKMIAPMRKALEEAHAALASMQKRVEELEARQPEKGERGPQGEPGKDAPPVSEEQIYAQVEKYLKENPPPRGEKGDPGEPGPAGKDADPVDPRDVARVLLDSEELESVVELRVKEEVSKLPPPKDGKDGAPGEKGEP